ncbi:MAG: hypothetical protein JW951_02350 [Lentisphaerae bacterium]|nr:hypothetical protein [Lentisphaerota bacterium]
MNAQGGPGDSAAAELELEREKIALERERLAHEREKLQLERQKLQSQADLYRRERRVIVSPTVGILVAIVFCLVGIGVGNLLARRNRIELDARQVDGKLFLQSGDGTEQQEAVAYLLLVK